MKVKHFRGVKIIAADSEGAKGASLRWLLGPEDEMPNFHMRMVEVEAGGHTMHHKHPYEHECYILEGEGELLDEDGKVRVLKPGNATYVPADEVHQFRNKGESTFRFLCIIPNLEKQD